MNKIVAFIDFTALTDKTVEQSVALCQRSGAELTLLHILSKDSEAEKNEANQKLDKIAATVSEKGITCSTLIGSGSFFATAPQMLLKADCELAVIGTHGVKGLFQNLFGSNIWKLVSHLPCSAVVVSEATQVAQQGFSNVLMPIGPHADFEHKVHMTAELMADNGVVNFFAIDKAGIEINKTMLDRVHAGKEILSDAGFKSEFIQFESQQFSAGFAKETLSYGHEHKADLIAIMTRVSEENAHFGQYDKEAMLVNEFGIPVLCVR